MKFFVSTGEPSGDLHLSYLIEEIQKKDNNIEFYGVAGEKCKSLGVNIIQDIREISIMGFVSSIKKLKFLSDSIGKYINFIKDNNIDRVILIDYGGFNLKFLKALKKELPSIKVFYYIPPKLWVWGKKRIKTLKLSDYIMVIFPWELDFYKNYGVDAIYFGNPLTEINFEIEDRGDKILLLPGSRKQEIDSIIPIFLNLAKTLSNENFIIKFASKKDLLDLNYDFKKHKNIEIETEKKLDKVVKECKSAVAVSGTITLELALFNLPTTVVYKTNFLNYFIARYILNVIYISLPNIILNKEVFKELIQKDCTVKNIVDNIKHIDNNKNDDIKLIRKELSGNKIIENYANFLIKDEYNG